MPSDAELVWAARGGDAASLGVLLERYRPSLYGRALQILGNAPQAQDAVQETFLVALRKLDRLREPAAAAGWLHAVLRNVCRMKLRDRRGETPFDQLPASAEDGSAESSVEATIDRLATRDWVWTALATLPEALRVTAMLRYFGNHATYEEISATLGIPVGTVKSRLNQAKIKLADALLQTAGLAHDEARRLSESRALFFEAAWDEYNRGEGYELFASRLTEDAVFVHPDGTTCGRRWMVEEFEGDLEAGMKLRLTNVIASKDVAVVEGDYENPRDDPYRCPPAISMVGFYRDGKIPRMHLYFAPRPEGEEDRQQPEA